MRGRAPTGGVARQCDWHVVQYGDPIAGVTTMNWKTELEGCLDFNGDKLELLVVKERTIPMAAQAVHIDHPVFDREFDSGFGAVEGCKFTAWGGLYVYFPAAYDGSEWIDFVPRNPCLQATTHIGGE